MRNGASTAPAYLRLMDNDIAPPDEQALWRALLKQYCRLDALAMVMLWQQWRAGSGL